MFEASALIRQVRSSGRGRRRQYDEWNLVGRHRRWRQAERERDPMQSRALQSIASRPSRVPHEEEEEEEEGSRRRESRVDPDGWAGLLIPLWARPI